MTAAIATHKVVRSAWLASAFMAAAMGLGMAETVAPAEFKTPSGPTPISYYTGGQTMAPLPADAAPAPVIFGKEESYSRFLSAVKEGRISKIEIDSVGAALTAHVKYSGQSFAVAIPANENVAGRLIDMNAPVEIMTESPSAWGGVTSFAMMLLPIGLLIGAMIYLSRRNSGGGGASAAKSFGSSRAKRTEAGAGTVTFKDVAGVDEVKDDLVEIVDYLKDLTKYKNIGAKIPKGVLMEGPPGTGKTLLARAVAGEAGVPFFTISGSDFVEMFVGVGASRVRDLFAQAKAAAPCIIFIDEIDAVGRARSNGGAGSHDEREQTLNQLLVEMDGFDGDSGVIIIAATNRADLLDKALTRPGRFDEKVNVGLPFKKGREEILRLHGRKVRLATDVNFEAIARTTTRFSGAELANLINSAALLAVRRGKAAVGQLELLDAREYVLHGAPKGRSMIQSPKELERTAWHEVGHAYLVAKRMGFGALESISIVPRTKSLGHVMFSGEDETSQSYNSLVNSMIVAAGGRLAELIKFEEGSYCTGASGDIAMVTNIAEHMVRHWGMGDGLGFLNYGTVSPAQPPRALSEASAAQVDAAIRGLADKAYQTAEEILRAGMTDMERLVGYVLKYETLTGEQVRDVMEGREPRGLSEDDIISQTPELPFTPSSVPPPAAPTGP